MILWSTEDFEWPIVHCCCFFFGGGGGVYADMATLDTPLLVVGHVSRANKAMHDSICRLMSYCTVRRYETDLANG